MKKLLLTLCMMLALLVGVAAAEQTEFEPGQYHKAWYRNIAYNQIGDFEYIVLNDGTAEIVGYSGNDANLTIPTELSGVLVTSIGYEAFYNCTSLVSVAIPEDVTYIGIGAFRYCNHLTSIVIPHGVTAIQFMTFAGCPALTSVTIPDSVTAITTSKNWRDGDYEWASVFVDCPNLTLTVTPNSAAEKHAEEYNIPYIYPPAAGGWTCPQCQNYNLDNFCTECGEKFE